MKQRRWYLTAWLILMITVNSMAILSLLMAVAIKTPIWPPPWTMHTLAQRYLAIANVIIGIANVVFSVALLRWKKWGVSRIRRNKYHCHDHRPYGWQA